MPKKVKESLIPPLDFVVPVSASKIPFNNEFVQCTAKHPIVKTVISKEQPSWIEPHFDSSRQRQPHPRAVSAFNGKGSSFKNKGVVGPLNFSSNGQALQKAQNESPKVKPQCPLVPPVTPPPVLHSGQMLEYTYLCNCLLREFGYLITVEFLIDRYLDGQALDLCPTSSSKLVWSEMCEIEVGFFPVGSALIR
ncbi:hypothetical protein EGR_06648 [Echinococcus granulosus]|uniref:Uncharacterized protein n=1 Tax=Echinococcus granulosus TaxID=6210 RepID=W6UK43_ECHGR|nr:hypothetical protein EGR_06648 [Echinococcus granulosus]EUB58467.1 hypothetical protein EGR_06648 [Echinococcus granulosus]